MSYVAFALSSAPTEDPETPVARLFRRWEVAQDFCRDTSLTGPEQAATCTVVDAIERRLLATPSRNAHDVLLKLAALTDFGGVDLGEAVAEPLWAEVRAMLAGRRWTGIAT